MKAAGGGFHRDGVELVRPQRDGDFSAYCASKAALISLTHSAAAELAADKIRVNSVAPGNVATSMHFTALREEAEKRGITFEEIRRSSGTKFPSAAPPTLRRLQRPSPSWRRPTELTSPARRST